jgi:amino-acid N-acetyltransferase
MIASGVAMGAMLRPARVDDLAAVERLLVASGLPLDGVVDALATFTIAESGVNIVGTAGMEVRGDVALVRSVAVDAAWRSRGLGRALVHHVIADASSRGIRALFLLTTTAERYFSSFGFRKIARDEVPSPLCATAEFQGACPDSATVMRYSFNDAG